MEASGGVALRCLSGAALDTQSPSSSKLLFPSEARRSRVSCVRGRKSSSGVFADNGHLQYYVSPKAGGGLKEKEKEKEKKVSEKDSLKKKLKLVKGMSKDLLQFSSMGFDQPGLIGEFNQMKIEEATRILLSQLKQLKAEEKELKRKMKEDKAKLKAESSSSSSSSSSESSDNESKQVINLASLRTGTITEPQAIEFVEAPESKEIGTSGIAVDTSPSTACVGEKIEVCTGGKCKKFGAAALMEEFQQRLGGEGVGAAAVVGCKCMGKCREGPNVRVVTSQSSGDMAQANPLCLGVGLEDVGVIVSNFFGEGTKELGLMAG